MPLIGKLKSTGERIDITQIERPRSVIGPDDCICPLCDSAFTVYGSFVRDGSPVRAHFKHRVKCTSNYDSHPETIYHSQGKRWLRDQFLKRYADQNVQIDLEVPIPMEWRARGRVADILIKWPLGWMEVHEIQLASITTQELEQRTNDYNRAGCDVCWWIGMSADTTNNRLWLMENFGETLLLAFESDSGALRSPNGITQQEFLNKR